MAVGLEVRQSVDRLLLSLVAGEPLDEAIHQLQDLRRLADDLVAKGKDLQHTATDSQLVEWAMRDEAFLAVLVSWMEGR